jgi:hypothetical protein
MENSDFLFFCFWSLHAESIDFSLMKSMKIYEKFEKVWYLSWEKKENWKNGGKKIEFSWLKSYSIWIFDHHQMKKSFICTEK